jgi:hypothetical protein
MLGASLFRFPHRRSLVWCIALSLLVVQGLRVHFHTFADHEPAHGHSHVVELHVGGIPTDSGHDDPASEAVLAKFAILKLKQAHADGFVLPLAVVVLLFAFTSQRPWRPARFVRPTPGGDVRTPPLRAPPR